jgi:hypothetical protein
MLACALHRAPRPISTGSAITPVATASEGRSDSVNRRTTPVVRSARTIV